MTRTALKPMIALLLTVCLLITGVSCAKNSSMQTEEAESTKKTDIDLFSMKLTVKVERTCQDGDPHYLYALFPDGETGFYQSTQPGVLPEIRDLNTGKLKKLTLSKQHLEEVEDMFRMSVVMSAKRFTSGSKDTSALEEKVQSLSGFDIFSVYMNPLALRYDNNAITSARSDFLILQDNNVSVGGAFDPKTGQLYNSVHTENGVYYPCSAYGEKLVGVYGMKTIGIYDTSDGSMEVVDVFERVPFDKNGDPWYYQCSNAAYLADGSIAVIISGQAFIEKDRYGEDRLAILRTDGGTELYELNEPIVSGLQIVSNDPTFVIVQSQNFGLAAPRLIDRATGEVTALNVKGTKIVSVSLDEMTDESEKDGRFRIIDVLNDGKTLLVQDLSTGALAIFRPDTMKTKLLKIKDDCVYLCYQYSGNHNGKLCSSYYSRDGQDERGLLLTIVDENGDPVF